MIIFLKTEEEINGFKRAGKFAAQVLQRVLDSVKVGITTEELDLIARQECIALGVNPIFLGHEGFPAAICASNNNVMVHGIPTKQPLQKDDILKIDVGIEIDGFIGDTAETIIVGNDDSTQTYKLVLQEGCRLALLEAIKVAKDGNKLSDISAKIYETANKTVSCCVPTEYGGHGIDVGSMHAPPFIPNIPDEEHDFTLRAGMILAIEPMFILGNNPTTSVLDDGWSVVAKSLSAHCEHTVLVDFRGGIALTERGGLNG